LDLDLSVISDNLPFIISGFLVTLELAASVAVLAMMLGVLLALGRLYGPAWLRPLIIFYIDTMRSIPELAVMICIFLAIPVLSGLSLPPFWAALVALSLQVAAYVAEVTRAGLSSLRRGQMQAGLSLGMSRSQVVRRILLPQAMVRMLPSYGSVLTLIIKDTAIASLIAAPDLMYNSEVLALQTYRSEEVFTFAMVLYFLVLFPTTRAVEFLYRRIAHLGRS
jgi:polar amino acid transport system permease protein